MKILKLRKGSFNFQTNYRIVRQISGPSKINFGTFQEGPRPPLVPFFVALMVLHIFLCWVGIVLNLIFVLLWCSCSFSSQHLLSLFINNQHSNPNLKIFKNHETQKILGIMQRLVEDQSMALSGFLLFNDIAQNRQTQNNAIRMTFLLSSSMRSMSMSL